jgi:hypothetical protein
MHGYAVVPFWLYHGIAILPLVLVEALDDRLKRLQVVKVRLCGLVAAEFDRTTKKHRRTVWR